MPINALVCVVLSYLTPPLPIATWRVLFDGSKILAIAGYLALTPPIGSEASGTMKLPNLRKLPGERVASSGRRK